MFCESEWRERTHKQIDVKRKKKNNNNKMIFPNKDIRAFIHNFSGYFLWISLKTNGGWVCVCTCIGWPLVCHSDKCHKQLNFILWSQTKWTDVPIQCSDFLDVVCHYFCCFHCFLLLFLSFSIRRSFIIHNFFVSKTQLWVSFIEHNCGMGVERKFEYITHF